MSQITLYGNHCSDATIVSNRFIDEHMKYANDAQVKIYLYLLRCMSADMPISVSIIADQFNYTEKDVLRALKYWEKTKLLSLDFDTLKNLSGIQMHSYASDAQNKESEKTGDILVASVAIEKGDAKVEIVQIPSKTSYTANQLVAFKNHSDVAQLLFIAEQYICKTLSTTEISSLLYMYDSLHFSAELIEYLIEYCVTNKKKSMRYMETVALSWAESGITTVEEAKETSSLYRKEIYDVLKALGLNGRNPAESEVAYIKRWTDTYRFTTDIIIEACNRTIASTQKASFKYADSILKNWYEQHVKHLSDVFALDEAFHKSKEQNSPPKKEPIAANKFNNFKQHSYNFSELEQEILSN